MLDRRASFQLEFRSLWLNWVVQENRDLLTMFPQYSGEVMARLASKIFYMRTRTISHFSRILDEVEVEKRLERYQEYLRANRDDPLRRELERRIEGSRSLLVNAVEALRQKYLIQ